MSTGDVDVTMLAEDSSVLGAASMPTGYYYLSGTQVFQVCVRCDSVLLGVRVGKTEWELFTYWFLVKVSASVGGTPVHALTNPICI